MILLLILIMILLSLVEMNGLQTAKRFVIYLQNKMF